MARLAHYQEAHRTGDRAAVQRLVVEGRAEAAVTHVDGIPRILHRVVPEAINATAEAWWQRWAELHPTWRLMTWRDPLDKADFPLTSPHWKKVSCGAQLADLVRLEVLLIHGGIYVDQDMEPFRSLEPLLGAQVVAAWEDEKVVPNAVLGARPDHEAIRLVLADALRNMRRSVWEAGPGATTRVLVGRTDTLLLPPASFYDVHYRDPDRDAKMLMPASPWTFARHHYWGSWLPEARRKVPA
jgi:mannosyltransferase OCH1-like enzyme